MRIQKYQTPANGIIKLDNTYVAKPIELTFIKRTYQPSLTYLSQDNRTRLQHELGQKQADEAYNQQIKDKNTAEALNHLIGFSNFADIVGLGSMIGLGIKQGVRYGIKQAAKSQMLNVKIGDLLPPQLTISAKNLELPTYATPNSPLDPIDLHSDRLIKGGFERLPGMVNNNRFYQSGLFFWPYKAKSLFYNINYYDRTPKETADKIVEDFATALKNIDLPVNEWYLVANKQVNSIGAFATPGTGNVYIGKDGLRKIVDDYGAKNINRTISHEIDHALHIPTESAKGFNLEYLRKSTPSLPNYFFVNGNTELAARGTLIKDYFGLNSPNLEITEDMLKYAALNYVRDTGMDNNMTMFFNSITDWKEAAKWLSKHATIVGAPLIINKTNK